MDAVSPPATHMVDRDLERGRSPSYAGATQFHHSSHDNRTHHRLNSPSGRRGVQRALVPNGAGVRASQLAAVPAHRRRRVPGCERATGVARVAGWSPVRARNRARPGSARSCSSPCAVRAWAVLDVVGLHLFGLVLAVAESPARWPRGRTWVSRSASAPKPQLSPSNRERDTLGSRTPRAPNGYPDRDAFRHSVIASRTIYPLLQLCGEDEQHLCSR